MSSNHIYTVQGLIRRCGNRYPAEIEARLVNEVAGFLNEAPTVGCIVDTYPQPAADGVHPTLLVLQGTVPITFSNVTYQIPVKMWITEFYPNYQPLVFVNPTSTMEVKPNHPHVDASGFVKVPYIERWNSMGSSLSGLFRELAECFSKMPPVYAKKAPRISPSISSSSDIPAAGMYESQTSLYDTSKHSLASGVLGSAEEQRRETLQREVERKLQYYFGEMRREHEDDLTKTENKIEDLNAKISALQSRTSSVQQSCIKSEETVVSLRTQKESLEKYVASNCSDDLDATLGVFQDVQARQIMQCIADDLALQDGLYVVEEALEAGIIDLPSFLTETRRLSREQFRARALIRKIRLLQAQQRAEPGVGRPS